MTKTTAIALGVALSIGTAYAQPAPEPASQPATAPAPAPKEKASTESLQDSGRGNARPWAAGVTPEQQKRAMELFREGNTNHNDGLFVKAAELYQQALESWDHPAIHYNLALSLMNLDRPIDVERSLQKAITYGDAPLNKDKYDHAKEYLLLVQQQLATVDISCSKPGAKVSVDGKEAFTVGTKGEGGAFKSRVKIGKHTFVAEKPGYNAEIEAPFIGPGETFRIELKLYTAEELTRYRRRWQATWVPYVVIGSGVAVALVGAAFEMSAKSSYNDFDDAVARCAAMTGSSACSANLSSMRDSGDSKRTIGYIAYGVAGATIATGAVLLWLNRTETYQITADEYRREVREKQKTSVAPLIGAGTAGAMVRGAF
jgi:hypothetical protein